MPEYNDLLAAELSKKFISRPDAKAMQVIDGSWRLVTVDGKAESERLPWKKSDILAHVSGHSSFGHYLLSQNDTVKFFAFDIDLKANKPNGFMGTWVTNEGTVYQCDPRTDWKNRAHPSRDFFKTNMMHIAACLAYIVRDDLGLPTCVAYSGSKGVHVYAFTGPIAAADAREGAKIVLDTFAEFAPTRGDNFFESVDQSYENGFRNFSIEVFPKQDSLEGKDLGNLMRLPLGKNFKNTKDQAFFVDMTQPLGTIKPIDPLVALRSPNPWSPNNE